MYAVHLPSPNDLPESLRVKFFRHHDTFAAYLRVWGDLGYNVDWPEAHIAVIVSKRTTAATPVEVQAITEFSPEVVESSKIWQNGLLIQRPVVPSLGPVLCSGASSLDLTA